jgi:hypothetical protein
VGPGRGRAVAAVVFADGRSVVDGCVSRFSFGANKRAPASAVHVADTSTLREPAREFAADGTPIGPVAIRATSRDLPRSRRRPRAPRAARRPSDTRPRDARGLARARACPSAALASRRYTRWCRSPRTTRSLMRCCPSYHRHLHFRLSADPLPARRRCPTCSPKRCAPSATPARCAPRRSPVAAVRTRSALTPS